MIHANGAAAMGPGDSLEDQFDNAHLLEIHTITWTNRGTYAWPRLLFSCHHLTSLALPGNRLTEVPDAICALTALTGLNLSDNHIAHVSHKLGQCTRLMVLNLANNWFATLPPELAALRLLRELRIEGSPNYRASHWDNDQYIGAQTALAYISKRFAYGNGARDACIAFMLYYRRLGLPKDVAVSCIARRWVWPTRDDDDVWYEPNVAAKDRRAGRKYVPTYSRG